MDLAISPYHLTTREPPAMVALLVARRVLTLAPAPRVDSAATISRASASRGGVVAEAALDAAMRAPTYASMMRAWEWSRSLWRAGVLVATRNGDDASHDVHAVNARIASDDAFMPLRALMREELLGDDVAYLEALATDLLKGGPNPGLSIPLVAAIDRYASRQGVPVVRAQPASIAQREELSLGKAGAAIVLPVLLQATGERVLHAREVLCKPLQELHEALGDAMGSVTDASLAKSAREAAAAYHAAFEASREAILDGSRDDEVRAIEGCVVVTPMILPADAVLTSSVRALRALGEPTRVVRPTARSVVKPEAKQLGKPELNPDIKSSRKSAAKLAANVPSKADAHQGVFAGLDHATTAIATTAIATTDAADRLPVRTWIIKVMGKS